MAGPLVAMPGWTRNWTARRKGVFAVLGAQLAIREAVRRERESKER